MCEWGDTALVYVKIAADLSATGAEQWKHKAIDSCIANLVRVLQGGGIDMRGSCCGHGGMFGNIYLQDGRVLVIATEEFLNRPCWYLFKMCLAWVKLWAKLWARGIILAAINHQEEG